MSEPFLMTPVFCTANIPSKTIDNLLTRSASRAKETDLSISQLYIVSSRDDTELATAQPMIAPVPSRAVSDPTNPFLGLSIDELREEFQRLFGAKVKPTDCRFAHSTFIVLDARSVKDETCLLVSCSVDEGEARSDFFVPVEVLNATEIGTAELNEGLVPSEWKDPEGGDLVFYDVERWKKYVRY